MEDRFHTYTELVIFIMYIDFFMELGGVISIMIRLLAGRCGTCFYLTLLMPRILRWLVRK
jgi:hypothetical protein